MTHNRKTEIIEITYEMLASKNKRFANYLIDFIVMYIICIILGVLSTVIYFLFDIDFMVVWITQMNQLQSFMLGAVIVILYYGILETITLRSIGKLITGTRVIMEDGTKPEANAFFIRTLCRIIPFEAFSFLGDTSRGWHDSISKTVVIDIKKYESELYLKNSLEDIGNSNI